MKWHLWILCIAAALVVGCGEVVENDGETPDSSVPQPDAMPECGNGVLEAGETCDDGNPDVGDSCDPACATASCLVPVTHETVQAGVDDEANCPTVWIYSGTYTETVSITRDVVVESVGAAEVVLDGGEAGTTLTIAPGAVTLRGFKITGGSAQLGGGIYNEAALTLDQMTIEANTAIGETSSGGGIYTTNGDLLLDATTVTMNVATSTGMPGGAPSARGGGIYAETGSITLSNGSQVVMNSVAISGHPNANGSGGGIYASSTSVELNAGTAVRDNRVEIDGGNSSANGGGIYSTGGGSSIALIEDAGIENNLAKATGSSGAFARGGGVFSSRNPLTINLRSRLNGNTALAEGPDGTSAIAGAAYVDEGNVIISTSEVRGNAARALCDGTGVSPSASTQGGAFRSDSGFGQFSYAITDSTIADNVAEASNALLPSNSFASGGAAYISSPTGSTPPIQAINLIRSTVSNNRATSGGSAFGGAFYARSGTGSATVVIDATNSTISGNAAESTEGTASGGAIYAATGTGSSRAEVFLNSATISANSATGASGGSGGGLWLDNGISSSVTAAFWQNSIVWGNTATTSPECVTSGMSVTSRGYNLLGDTTGCALAGSVNENVTADPLMGELGDNAGPTHTHPLSGGSPAVNAGSPSGCIDSAGAALSTDQRGQPRAALGRCDIGAFEYIP